MPWLDCHLHRHCVGARSRAWQSRWDGGSFGSRQVQGEARANGPSKAQQTASVNDGIRVRAVDPVCSRRPCSTRTMSPAGCPNHAELQPSALGRRQGISTRLVYSTSSSGSGRLDLDCLALAAEAGLKLCELVDSDLLLGAEDLLDLLDLCGTVRDGGQRLLSATFDASMLRRHRPVPAQRSHSAARTGIDRKKKPTYQGRSA